MTGFRGDLERRRVTAPELSWALRGLVPVGAESDQEPRRLGLRPLDNAAMSHTMTSQAPSGPAQLSKRLEISIGSATELVDRLERAAHLIRRPQAQDPRSVVLQPGDAVTGVLGSPRPLRQRFAVCRVHRGGAVGDRALSALDGTPLPQLGALGGSTITEHTG